MGVVLLGRIPIDNYKKTWLRERKRKIIPQQRKDRNGRKDGGKRWKERRRRKQKKKKKQRVCTLLCIFSNGHPTATIENLSPFGGIYYSNQRKLILNTSLWESIRAIKKCRSPNFEIDL
jgi:hypothetical protein